MIRKIAEEFYNLLRDSAHKAYVDRIKSIYQIHPSFVIGHGTIIAGSGSIEIGANSYIGYNSFITAEPSNCKIVIGAHCSLGHNIHIRTQRHVKKRHYKNELNSPLEGADIIIGDYVWIGTNVYISGGVSIGENVIIGANSVVTKNIPPNTIYAGVPARLIRQKSEYIE